MVEHQNGRGCLAGITYKLDKGLNNKLNNCYEIRTILIRILKLKTRKQIQLKFYKGSTLLFTEVNLGQLRQQQ
jgi:hypothetical protein